MFLALLLSMIKAADVACAIAITDDGAPVRAFCASNTSVCTATTAALTVVRAPCASTSFTYYQDAIYWSAGRDTEGHRVAPPRQPRVILSAGTHLVSRPLPCWYPLGNSTGLHIPSGVHLTGSRDAAGARLSVIAPAPSCDFLQQLVLISDERVGTANMTDDARLTPARDASLSHLALLGVQPDLSTADAVGSWGGTPWLDSALSCDSSQQAGSRVVHGVTVSAAAAITIDGVLVRGVQNTGIQLGLFSQFLPDTAADVHNPGCANESWCLGKRLLVLDATVRASGVCAALQGVTVIGRNVTVVNNSIAVTTQTWTSAASLFGITMGVSAGFVGSAEVVVANNTIHGGDYAVGCDGSFPLYTPVQLFDTHWGDILRCYPSWRAKYPGGPVNHSAVPAPELILRGNDFVLAQQVLLDLASAHHAASSDPRQNDVGFISSLQLLHNTVRGSVCGVSIYRTRDSLVADNSLEAAAGQPLAMFGVSVSASHNNVVSGNRLAGWRVALQALGAPLDDPRGCGSCQSRWGSSQNTFLGNTAHNSSAGVILGYGGDAGRDNQVASNIMAADVELPCDYSHAFSTNALDNAPESCNTIML